MKIKLNAEDATLQKTIVMISNSYGVNIFIKQLEEIIKKVRKGDDAPTLWFISSTNNKNAHKYVNYLQFISKKHTWINILYFFSKPSTEDIESEIHFISGSVNIDEIKNANVPSSFIVLYHYIEQI